MEPLRDAGHKGEPEAVLIKVIGFRRGEPHIDCPLSVGRYSVRGVAIDNSESKIEALKGFEQKHGLSCWYGTEVKRLYAFRLELERLSYAKP